MRPEVEEALARWESGDLSRDELIRRFPDEDVAGLLDTVERMRAAADVATPDATTAWEAVRDQLLARLDDRRKRGATGIRLLAAAMIAVLLMGATAYALVPSVRRAVDDAMHVIIGVDDRPIRQADPGSVVDDPPANTSGEKSSAASGTGEATGDDESEQAADADSDTGPDGDEGTDGEGSGSGSNDDGAGDEQASNDGEGSSGDEGSTDEDPGTGSEEAHGDDDGSSTDGGRSGDDSGIGSEE
jgi:hypothetical protein